MRPGARNAMGGAAVSSLQPFLSTFNSLNIMLDMRELIDLMKTLGGASFLREMLIGIMFTSAVLFGTLLFIAIFG